MFTVKQPNTILFGKYSSRDFAFPENCLIITSKGAKNRGWLNYLKIKNYHVFDSVESNPSIKTAEEIISDFKNLTFSYVVGLGGGSSLDVAKFVASKIKTRKILIPTTFGSGSEVTRISVLKVNGKKQSFHDDRLIADIAIVDSNFIKGTPMKIIRNSAIDSCAQCTEAYDSKISNPYTKFLCETAFEILESATLKNDLEKLALGSLLTGLGFGNSSTTLGHALSYVYSNEGIMHGHALAHTTTVAHKFNNSKFYERFLKIVNHLKFSKITLSQDLRNAAKLILADKKHLDNNPRVVTEEDVVILLEKINNQ